MRELECFLVLSEELHFGRTAERLYISQGRVSQLLRALERRIGVTLVERTSRKVALTDSGAKFCADLRPAHRLLASVVDEAKDRARATPTPLLVGFQCAFYESIAKAVSAFERNNPDSIIQFKELPLGDPFSDVLAARIDAAVCLLPVAEPELVTGPVFSRQQQTLAVATGHPFAALPEITAEQLADVVMVPVWGPAPEYWRQSQSPERTPSGRPIQTRAGVSTVQEGLMRVTTSNVGLLLCRASAEHYSRPDISHVPVTGLPESALGLVWRADNENDRIRRFAQSLAGALD